VADEDEDEDAADFAPNKASDAAKGKKREREVQVKVESEDEDAAGETDEEYGAGMNKKAKTREATGGAEMTVEGFESMQKEFDD